MEQMIENRLIGAEPNTLAQVDAKGRISGSGVSPEDIPSFPEGGNVGDVLTKTADGTEWATPQSGGSSYNHHIVLSKAYSSVYLSFNLISDSNTPFTSLNSLGTYFSGKPNGFTVLASGGGIAVYNGVTYDYYVTHLLYSHGTVNVMGIQFANNVAAAVPATILSNLTVYYDSVTDTVTAV